MENKYYTREGNRWNYLHVVNVTWHQTPRSYIIRLWPKPHLIGCINTRNWNWMCNNLITKEHFSGTAVDLRRAKDEVIGNLLSTVGGHNLDLTKY